MLSRVFTINALFVKTIVRRPDYHLSLLIDIHLAVGLMAKTPMTSHSAEDKAHQFLPDRKVGRVGFERGWERHLLADTR